MSVRTPCEQCSAEHLNRSQSGGLQLTRQRQDLTRRSSRGALARICDGAKRSFATDLREAQAEHFDKIEPKNIANKTTVLRQIGDLQKQLESVGRQREIEFRGKMYGKEKTVTLDKRKMRRALRTLKAKVEKLSDQECKTLETTIENASEKAERTFQRRWFVPYIPSLIWLATYAVGMLTLVAGWTAIIALLAVIPAYIISKRLNASDEVRWIADFMKGEHGNGKEAQ